MISSSSAASVTGLLALLLSGLVFAGQLFIDSYGLKEVADGGSALLVGVVESVAPPKDPKKSHDSTITFEVEKVIGPASTLKEGTTATLTVYGGVVWDDPRKSPIDRRLAGAVGPEKGKRMIAVLVHGPARVELLPATEAKLRTVSILWDAAARMTWLASPDATLAADLADPDLAPMAIRELEKRGTLTPAQLLAADESFFFAHMREMAPEKKMRFLADATPLAKNDGKIRDRLFRTACYEPRPQWIAAAAPLIAMYDRAKKEDERNFDELHLALVIVAGGVKEKRFPGPLDLSDFAEFLVTYEKSRPRHKSSDDDLPMLTSHMNAKAKAAVAAGFLESVRTSTFAGKEYDLYLMHEAARLAKEAPDASIIAPMAKIDPTLPHVTSTKESVMEALLAIGSAVVAGVPSERSRVQDALQPWIDRKVAAPKDSLALYLAVVGEPKKAPAEKAAFELGSGDSKRLATGVRVAFAKRDDGWFELTFQDGEQEQSWGIDPALGWYREYWVEPYLVTFDRIGALDRVRLTVEPRAKTPAQMEDPEGYEIAKALAKKAGCPDYERHESRAWEGRFEYVASGPGGKSCTIVIGSWTRKVVHDGS